uniref:Uncharacterized protein n=1 Tax=Octopus bimaculoides TaxID=37653 RepID=A0A0L8IFB5_OCTBM
MSTSCSSKVQLTAGHHPPLSAHPPTQYHKVPPLPFFNFIFNIATSQKYLLSCIWLSPFSL